MAQPLSVDPSGQTFIELPSTDSTNNYARELIRANGLPERQPVNHHGTAVFAHFQAAGRGQRGKAWTGEKGENIALSVLLNTTPMAVSRQFELSVTIALATARFFAKYAGDETRIKWPNDLYWQDRKAGGILIENSISAGGQWEWAVCGIGININQTFFPPELPNPVSLKQISGKKHDPVSLARELHQAVTEQFNRLCSAGFPALFTEYLDLLYKRGAAVKLKKENRVFEATIKGVSPDGRLLVQHAIEESFSFGEILWLPADH